MRTFELVATGVDSDYENVWTTYTTDYVTEEYIANYTDMLNENTDQRYIHWIYREV